MNYKKVYKDYCEKLLQLPMQDATFIAKLATKNLLPGNTESKIEAESIPVNKASCFLNSVIKPSLDVDNTNSFKRLLSVMKQCEYDFIKELAVEIESVLKGIMRFVLI